MPENEETPTHDRRLQSLVYDLDKKVHALELSDNAHKIEIAYLKGEIHGIRSSTASSFEVKAASDLINQSVAAVSAKVDSNDKLMNERLGTIGKDVAQLRAVLIFFIITLIGIVTAAFQLKIVAVQ